MYPNKAQLATKIILYIRNTYLWKQQIKNFYSKDY